MNPIHKEKYVLSMDTYGHFTIDQNKPKLEKNKRNIRITAVVQMLVGAIFIGSVIVLKQSNMFIFTVFALMLIATGVHGFIVKYNKYDKQIWANIENSYNGREYGDNWFEVKFFEDHLKYLVGGNTDELHYNDFAQFFETEHYFCIHFITGDLLIFNPDCNKAKIRDIILSFRKKGESETAEVAEAVYTVKEPDLEEKLEAAEERIEEKLENIEDKIEAKLDAVEDKIEEIIEG